MTLPLFVSGIALWFGSMAITMMDAPRPKQDYQIPEVLAPFVGKVELDPEKFQDPQTARATAQFLSDQFKGRKQPESVRMLIHILRGADIGPRDGWFGPAQKRYDWDWLCRFNKLNPNIQGITRTSFRGSKHFFTVLDRDGNGQISAQDLDWSEHNPWVRDTAIANRLFRRLNAKGDGLLTRAELDSFFLKANSEGETLTLAQFRAALFPPSPVGSPKGDAPSIPTLVKGLYRNEIGCLFEGPDLNAAAPDFQLKSISGKETIQLSKLTGAQPIVLVFGNFSCGPFRRYYPEVDHLFQKYKDQAKFVMVYVREAHPEEGWKMESNRRAGVSVHQPQTYAERSGNCREFCNRLKPSMPVVVDELNDVVGNAYGGMPARLYVIDAKGKIAYKGGRGPFGFHTAEMEQALVLCLLESLPVAEEKPK